MGCLVILWVKYILRGLNERWCLVVLWVPYLQSDGEMVVLCGPVGYVATGVTLPIII